MANQPENKSGLPEIDRETPPQSLRRPPPSNAERLLQVLTIVVVTFWIFSPAMNGDWLWDDNVDITENVVIHDPDGLWKIWFKPGSLEDYYPIKASVQWMQWHLWHNHTFGYHLTNVLLHIISAFLIWRLFGKLGLRLAWLGGLIFAIHPVQVESVAWIAELKNTLSLPPFLLAMCAWIDYENHGKLKDYFLALGLFLAAMLCKPTMIMFPTVILLYAWWKRGADGWRDVKDTLPFFIVSLALGTVTLCVGNWYEQLYHSPSPIVPIGGLFSRLALAGLSISFYFSQSVLPVELVPLYPRWPINPPSLLQFLPWPILGATIYFLWTKRATWGRHVLLGLVFFLINLIPFIGFIGISFMIFSWVMNHFLYIPLIGLIGLAMAGLDEIRAHLSPSLRSFGTGIVAVIMIFLIWESHDYAGKFVSQETLWTYTVEQAPSNWAAHNNLALTLSRENQMDGAIEHFQQAIKINPDATDIHVNLAIALMQTNRIPEAIDQFQEALRINPNQAEVHGDLGVALMQAGRISEAIKQCEAAIKIRPDYVEARANLGNAFYRAHRFPEAVEQDTLALKTLPDSAALHSNLGDALMETGQISEAINQFQQALKIDPDLPGVRPKLEEATLKMSPPKN